MTRPFPFSVGNRGSASARSRFLCAASLFAGATLLGLLLFGAAACKSRARTSDPRLKKIEEMLDGQLPPGTSLSRVTFFLNARGYEYRIDDKEKKVVAIIPKVDEETLTRVVARVEFEFDPHDKLVNYELFSEPAGP